MSRLYNFSAGPATIYEDVLKCAQDDMLEYQDTGMSVMEMSHRGKDYKEIFANTKSSLKQLLNINDDYEILFMQGGASMQFAAIPLNLLSADGLAQYIVSGSWSKKAYKEATKFGNVECVASSEDKTFSYIPNVENIEVNPNADYFYICQNETIYGTYYKQLPKCNNVPLIADMSSCFVSEPIDVTKYGMIYAGAQKNAGPAGVCIVIIRKDLLEKNAQSICPTMLEYTTYSNNDSMYNTPPTYTIYICGLIFQHILNLGGLEAIAKTNYAKAELLYNCLDNSKIFKSTVAPHNRSIMNVPFVSGDEEIDKKFIAQAKEAGLVNLAGHRSVGGMRASIYNAMSIEGVEKLVDFIEKFEKENL
ncbi:MAG: 3-phosphoserine/phosphohydroxythreonine transaminase [Coriobacteriales bacterium]|nr:3-phosphoserine/phosphohydroxythreonine transaminase [Coriobacteriales bacterium]